MPAHSWQTEVMKPILPLISIVLACVTISPEARPDCLQGCLGTNNTRLGENTLAGLTSGFNNTAVGSNALSADTEGSGNTATGFIALLNNSTGFNNTAIGTYTLESNTRGSDNTGLGANALASNTKGEGNTATGTVALNHNTTGTNNMAAGFNALLNNTTGNNNIALGFSAGVNLSTGDNNIDIGNAGVAGEANTIRIGTTGTQSATFIAGIRETLIAGGIPIGVTADGQLGVRACSARFKENVKPMDKASEAILALRPVTFRYKKEIDAKAMAQFGLIAEEVEKVNPDLVARDGQGKPYTVRYESINAMLLNEFLKQHQKVEEQSHEIAELKAALKEIGSRLETNGL